MKMASHFTGWAGCGALLILSGTLLHAETPARLRGSPIIFSGPKSDVVSSNLNELRSPASPFREMESTLKKPFELFAPKPGDSPYTAPRRPPPQPAPNQKPLKDILNARAESMFLDPQLHEGETDDDLYKSAADALDLSPNKPRNALDRYYDRMDRAVTNRTFSPEALGATKDARDPLDRRTLNPFGEPRDWENQRNPAANKFRPLAGPDNFSSPTRLSYFDARPSPAELERDGGFKSGNNFSGYREPKENRMDAFKRLLEGQSRSGNLPASSASVITPPQPSPYASPATVGTSYKPTSAPTSRSVNSFSKSAGLVGAPGTPQGLPDYTASSTAGTVGAPTPPPNKMPVSSFNLPKRRF